MIKKFVWTQEFDVGVEEINEQHREFFGIVNNLLDAAIDGSLTREGLLLKIGRLGDYASYHLGTEEDLFYELGYPGAPEHIQAHNSFREKTKSLIDDARNEGTDIQKVAKEAAEFAGNWLSQHILVMDKKYSEFFHKHGLK